VSLEVGSVSIVCLDALESRCALGGKFGMFSCPLMQVVLLEAGLAYLAALGDRWCPWREDRILLYCIGFLVGMGFSCITVSIFGLYKN